MTNGRTSNLVSIGTQEANTTVYEAKDVASAVAVREPWLGSRPGGQFPQGTSHPNGPGQIFTPIDSP